MTPLYNPVHVTTRRHLRLRQQPENFAIVQLPPDAEVPAWAAGGSFSSVSRAADELSVICPQENVPADVQASRGWRCLKLEGPFDLDEVGVLASVAGPLAEAGVSLFVLSTFNTDYLLVRGENLDVASRVLTALGNEVS